MGHLLIQVTVLIDVFSFDLGLQDFDFVEAMDFGHVLDFFADLELRLLDPRGLLNLFLFPRLHD